MDGCLIYPVFDKRLHPLCELEVLISSNENTNASPVIMTYVHFVYYVYQMLPELGDEGTNPLIDEQNQEKQVHN